MPKSKIFTDICKPYCLEIYYGPMWSRKTLNLLIDIDRLKQKKIPYQVFKPRIDTRYFADYIVSRFDSFVDKPMDDSSRFLKEPAEVFDENNPKEILDLIRKDTQAIIISEIQLVHPDIVRVVTSLQREGLYVICDGLNLDYTGEYFSLGLTNLISRATHPHSLYAICNFPGCGEAAYFSQKLNPDGTPAAYEPERAKRLEIGDYCYEPRCIIHHEVPGRPIL